MHIFKISIVYRRKIMRTNEKTTLYNFLSDSNKIIIPDIQRDYVLGSGKGKLSSLFEAMIEKARDSKEFEFSCILAYRDPENNVYIYDGQQRIVTLIYLCAKLNESENRNDIKNLLQKFEFKGRESANEWLRNPSKIHKQEAVDFTTFSIAKLRENFGEPIKDYNYTPEEKITLDFLLHKVKFDLIFIDRISDAEQFFMDVNDGLELKDYEIYKAELYHNAKAILGVQKFKEFALKMENEWFESFLEQRKKEACVNKEGKVSEEEELVFFLKFCFRMMWVEEKKSLEEYKETNFNWLEEKHFTRIEHILDSVIMYMSKEGDNRNKDLSCISYSCSSLSRGEHWSIDDKNYTKMLAIFIKNLLNTKQNCKDVVMWCFLSNIPYTKDGTNNSDLYKYLRFIKKILNVNRGCNENATMVYDDHIEKRRVHFALYYVKEIPKYYLNIINSTNDNNEKENGISDYLSSIIVANGKIELSTDKCYAEYFIEKCKNEKLKKVLDNEILKYKSADKEKIQEYENLPFINGLVDNFLEYSSSDCDLKDWVKKLKPETIEKLVPSNDEVQYTGILKFMCDELVYSEKILIDNIKIYWLDYQRKYVGYEEGSIVFHTWCDFFTQESVLKIQNDLDLKYKYLLDLPDGWIARDRLDQREKLYQIAQTTAKGKGFSAENPVQVHADRVKKLFDLSSFWTNFHEVRITEDKKYIINGKEETQLPSFLASYNNEKWVDNKLSTIDSIYYYPYIPYNPYKPYDFYFSNNYLNQVLLKMFQRNRGYSSGEFEKYLEKYREKHREEIRKKTDITVEQPDILDCVEIDGKRYFIKLVEII